MNIYIPYTYLIGWKKLDKWYYGVRYTKNCNPQDFWIKYFTSSKHVKQFIEKNGEPDIIEIRKTFENKEKAILWEHKVLKRMKAIHNKKWLNMSEGNGKWFNKGGYILSEKQKHNQIIANRLKAKNKDYLIKLRKPKANKEKYKLAAIRRCQSPEYIKKLSKKLKQYFKHNPFTEEHKLNISLSKKGIPNFKNRKPAKKYTCSVCNKIIGGKSNLLRYHENNCKNK